MVRALSFSVLGTERGLLISNLLAADGMRCCLIAPLFFREQAQLRIAMIKTTATPITIIATDVVDESQLVGLECLNVPQLDTAVGPQARSTLGEGKVLLVHVQEFSSPPQNSESAQQVLPQQVVPAAQ